MKTTVFLLNGLLAATLALAQQPATTPEARLDAFFKKAEKTGFSGSVLVAKAGKILLEKGYGWQDREKKVAESAATVFSVGSITKQFTGAAILKLEMQGKLSVQDPLSKFFPGAPADKAGITLHQLLTHTAGFPGAIGDDYELLDADAFARSALATPLEFSPGQRHSYSNVGYSLLGIIVEKVSGKGYEQFLYDNLWKPAGMEHTGYLRPGFKPADLAVGYRDGERWGTALDRPWMPDGPGWHLRANGGVLSTAGDMYRWFQALQGDQVLNAAAKTKYFKPQVPECPDCPTFYAYGWVFEQEPGGPKMFWHNGGNGVYNAYMGFEPDAGACIMVSSNSNDKIADDYAQQCRYLLDGGEPVPEATIQQFTGTYHLPSGSAVRVRFNEFDRLVMEWDDADAFRVLVGGPAENEAENARFATRSKTIVEQIQQNNFGPLAEATGGTPEEARERASGFWGGLRERFGPLQAVEPVGAAARRGGRAHFVLLRLKFEKATRYLTHVWAGEDLDDVRLSPVMDKIFERVLPTEYSSPANQLAALLRPDGTIRLQRKGVELAVMRR